MSVDQGCGIAANCANAWSLRNPCADFHFVIQDDAILCNNFRERVSELIHRLHQRQAFSLYMGVRANLSAEHEAAAKRGWWSSSLRWGVAVGLKSALIPRMLRAFHSYANVPQDDARIKRFLNSQNIHVYYPLPSLVDHRPGQSLVGDPGTGRHAYFFADHARYGTRG